MPTVTIAIDATPRTFALDIPHGSWRCPDDIPEAVFPLVAEVDGKRYELFSDGTLGEEELTKP
jgi:hypothetical protein